MQAGVNSAVDWAIRHPAEVTWLAENMERNAFARSLATTIDRLGYLTDNQLTAVRRNLVRTDARKATAAAAPVVDVGEIERRFDAARENLIKKPAMRLDTFVFKAAPEGGRNPGAIYVTDEGTGVYLGAVKGGRFVKSVDCDAEQQARVIAAASDPAASAEAYGRRTGNCSVCSRELTAEESIALFIGPICREKYALFGGAA